MADKQSGNQPRKSSRLTSGMKKTDDKLAPSDDNTNTTTIGQRDDQAEDGEGDLDRTPAKETKQGRKAAQQGKQKHNQQDNTSPGKRFVAPKTKKVTKSNTDGHYRGKARPQGVEASSSKNAGATSQGRSGRRPATAKSRESRQALPSAHRAGSQLPVNQPRDMYPTGGALALEMLAKGVLHSLGPPTYKAPSQSNRAGSHVSHQADPSPQLGGGEFQTPTAKRKRGQTQAGPSSRPGYEDQTRSVKRRCVQAQSDNQHQDPTLSSVPDTFQVPATAVGAANNTSHNGQALLPNPTHVPVPSNVQWGLWGFSDQYPWIPVPSYTYNLPRGQQEAIQQAAANAYGLLNGWLPVNLFSLHKKMSKLTEEQGFDIIETIKAYMKERPVNPQYHSSHERAHAASPEAEASHSLNDVIFYHEPAVEAGGRTKPVADGQPGKDAGHASFADMTSYSIRTPDGGRWYDRDFEAAGLYPFGNNLIAGINCPPNLLQQGDLTCNPYGRPPIFFPHAPALQRRNTAGSPHIATTNIEGRTSASRNKRESRSSLTDPGPSNQHIDTDRSRFLAVTGQPPPAHARQSNVSVICDSHDCEKQLGVAYVTCARCHRARYCNKYCQVFTWLVHLPTCELHPDAMAREVTALEEWATTMWNGAAKAVADAEKANAEKANAEDQMDIDGEGLEANTTDLSVAENSTSSVFLSPGDILMAHGDDEDQELVDAMDTSHPPARDNPGPWWKDDDDLTNMFPSPTSKNA